MIQISTGDAITLILAFLGMVIGFGKLLVSQFDKRIQERIAAQDELRTEQIKGLEKDITDATTQSREINAKLERLNTTLPLEYLRREDWIRFGATLEAKIDRLADYMFKAIGDRNARD